jgi:hypothetical protein
MNAVITYDVSERQEEVKAEMLKRKYFDAWRSNNVRYILPNSTLWKLDIELSAAKEELQTVISSLNKEAGKKEIVLERCLVFSVNPWDGIPGIERK